MAASFKLIDTESKSQPTFTRFDEIRAKILSDAFVKNIKELATQYQDAKVGVYIGFDLNATLNTVIPMLDDAQKAGWIALMMYYQELCGGNIRVDKMDKLTGKDNLKEAVKGLKLEKKDKKSLGPEVLTMSRLSAVMHPWGIIFRTELGLKPVADIVATGFEGDGLFNSPDAPYMIPLDGKYDVLFQFWIDNFAKPHHLKVRNKAVDPPLEFNENIQVAKRNGSFVDPAQCKAQSDSWLRKLPSGGSSTMTTPLVFVTQSSSASKGGKKKAIGI